MPQLPRAQEAPPKPKRNLEDFLGTQLFLKAGVAILVIGVVFAMGIVFQKMGPAGKLLMGYLGALAMLAGGLYAEKKPTYQTFGRSIIAGAWGILYFVTYAGGYIEASKVFTSEPVAIIALLVAATAAVAFSLRYRNEWTTTWAFLLIFLGLGMAAWDLQPTFNLTATAIVALAMAVLVWQTGWVRLLGFGVPATWGTLTFWILRRPHLAGDASLLGTLLLCWAAFQLVLIFFDGEEEREKWIGLSQIGNFLGGFGLCLHQTLAQGPEARPWIWAAGFGLANLLVAWAYARRGRRTMYLLAATEGLAALAFVTPLRLGWKNYLTPVYRLVGIELLLLGGVLLKEKYFRRVAYGAFAVTLLEILVLKLDPSLGVGRTLLLGTAAGIWLVNAMLLRTVWREACHTEHDATHELPLAPYAFGIAGTLMVAILIWIEAPLKLYALYYALLAVTWLALGWVKGYRDALGLSPVLGLLSAATAVWALTSLPGAPGTLPARWLGALGAAILLGLGGFITRKRGQVHAAIPELWEALVPKAFGCYAVAITWVLLFMEVRRNWTATGFAAFAFLLMALAVFGKLKSVASGALITLVLALLLFCFRPAEVSQATWHLTYRGWSALSLAVAAFGLEALVRSFKGRSLLGEAEGARWLTSLAGLCLLTFAVYTELPPQWRATGLAALAVLHLGFGLWQALQDRAFEALALFASALLLLIFAPAPSTLGAWHITLHGWSLLSVGSLAFVFEWLIRRPASEPLFSKALRVGTTVFVSLAGLALASFVLQDEAHPSWIAVGFGLGALLWLLLGLLWSHRDKAYASFALLALGLLTLIVKPATLNAGFWEISVRAWTYLGVGALAFALEFVTRREMTGRLFGSPHRQTWATLYVSLAGLVLGLLALFLEAPTAWLAVSLSALAILHLGLGILWSHKDRAYAAIGLLLLAMFVLWLHPASTATAWAHVTTRGWTLLGVAAAAFGLEAMVRIPASERVFDEADRQGALWLFSLAGTALALVLIWTEAPEVWIAPLMAGLSVVLLVLGLLLGFKEQVAGSVLTGLAGLGALLALVGDFHGGWLHITFRAWNLGILAGLALGQELTLRLWKKAWRWSEASLAWIAGGHSLVAVTLLGFLAILEFKTLWVPGSLMFFSWLWLRWARQQPSLLHAWEALALAGYSFVTMGFMLLPGGLQVDSAPFGLPGRITALGMGLLVAYLLQLECQVACDEPEAGPERLNRLMNLQGVATGCLFLTTVVFVTLIKVEAMARYSDEWVPLLWGVVALAYLERGRGLRKATWLTLGHGLMGLGLLHILAMNLLMDERLHGLSLRLWTCVPFIGMLSFTYAGWRRLHDQVVLAGDALLKNAYLFAAQGVLAAMLLFQLDRPWVVAAWAIQALLTLLFGVYRDSVPWLRVALVLATAATVRAFLFNFTYWEAGASVSERLAVIPLAVAALLAGYLRLRLWNPEAEAEDHAALEAALTEGRHRLPWFAMQAVLLITFIWLEASGTSLTVWATLFGFGMVGLGFMFRERVARLVGLGVLSACTLKLFLWDLRGLQGLARVGSFIVLGIVLITVSFVYTRFKERIGKLL